MINEKDISDQKTINEIISLASLKTGNQFRETHKAGILRFIDKHTDDLNISYQEYLSLLQENECEINALINASTVNETYFFREENQFNLLNKIISNKQKINIWSAACSSGEEAYSIKLLCDSLNKETCLFASDINTDKLNFLKEGKYIKTQALRDIDGKSFHNLLLPYVKDDFIIFPDKIRNSISCRQINLTQSESFKSLGEIKFDVIFLRNVFIYFSLEERHKILNNIAQNYLCEDGYIFVSLSEIAQLNDKLLPKLEKICIDDIFVLHRKITQEER